MLTYSLNCNRAYSRIKIEKENNECSFLLVVHQQSVACCCETRRKNYQTTQRQKGLFFIDFQEDLSPQQAELRWEGRREGGLKAFIFLVLFQCLSCDDDKVSSQLFFPCQCHSLYTGPHRPPLLRSCLPACMSVLTRITQHVI